MILGGQNFSDRNFESNGRDKQWIESGNIDVVGCKLWGPFDLIERLVFAEVTLLHNFFLFFFAELGDWFYFFQDSEYDPISYEYLYPVLIFFFRFPWIIFLFDVQWKSLFEPSFDSLYINLNPRKV